MKPSENKIPADNAIAAKPPEVVLNRACPGTLQKSHPDSYFIRFSIHSELAAYMMGKRPTHDGEPVVVIQLMSLGVDDLLAEVIPEENYRRATI